MMFEVGDLVFMNSPEWPYLNQIGKIVDTYINGANKLAFTVNVENTKCSGTSQSSRVGVSPELCLDARPILRNIKLEEILN